MPGQQGTRWTPDRVAIALGVAGSMAGNVTYAVDRGSPVLIGVGVGMSLVLPVAVRLWRSTPAPAVGWRRWERAAVMAAICLGAAVYSLVHIADVLHTAGLPRSIAWMPGAVMELLVVQAARASSPARSAGTRTSPPSRDRRPTQPSRPAPQPVSPPPPPVSPARPQLVPEPPAVDGDEPPVPDETPEDKRRRQERNKKRRQRAKKAEQDATTEEVTG